MLRYVKAFDKNYSLHSVDMHVVNSFGDVVSSNFLAVVSEETCICYIIVDRMLIGHEDIFFLFENLSRDVPVAYILNIMSLDDPAIYMFLRKTYLAYSNLLTSASLITTYLPPFAEILSTATRKLVLINFTFVAPSNGKTRFGC